MSTILYKSLFGFILILVVAVIGMTSYLGHEGSQTRNTDAQISALELENKDLRLAIASASSLTTIGERAAQLGFSAKRTVATIGITSSLALR